MDVRGVALAGPADLPALEQLENAAFSSDRISRRSWGRLLLSRSARVLVCRSGHALDGACVVLRREGSSVARLYSIAVAPAMQRAGVASGLLAISTPMNSVAGSAPPTRATISSMRRKCAGRWSSK